MKGIINLLKRMNNQYDKNELNLYNEIVDCFCSAHLGDTSEFLRFAPGEVNVEDGEKPINIIRYSLEFQSWQKKIGLGILWHFIEEISSSICAFQILRHQKLMNKLSHIVFHDTLNDPLSLALEEMKHWMIMELSKVDFSIISQCEDAKIEIGKRIDYVNRLSQLKTISTSEDSYEFLQSDITIFQIFLEIKHALSAHVIPAINLQISRQSSRDQFKSLVGSTERMIKQGLRFLFFIYRDSPNMMSHFSIQEMRHPKINANKVALNTGSGIIFQNLLKTQFFMDTFPDTYPPMALESGALQAINYTGSLSKAGLLALSNKQPNWWQESNRGISDSFAKEKIMDNFVFAHLLLMVQTTYYQLFQVGYDLAGDGGDLVVYGAAATDMKNLIENHRYFLHNLLTSFHDVHKEAEVIYTQRVYKKIPESDSWSQNYKYAISSYDDLLKSIRESYSALIKLQSGLESLTLMERLERVKAKLHGFKVLTKNISEHQEALMPREGTNNLSISTEHQQMISGLSVTERTNFVQELTSQLTIKNN